MATAWSLSGEAVLAPWRERVSSTVPSQRWQVEPTRSELLLWSALSELNLGWVREFANGRYRLDFFLPSHALAVEVDGSSHYGNVAREYDAKRDEWHATRGIETMRVSAEHVERDLPGVLEDIAKRVALRGLNAGAAVESPLSESGEAVV